MVVIKVMFKTLLIRGLRRLNLTGAYRIAERLCPTEGRVVAKVFGYHVKLDLADPGHRRVYCGTYKPEQYKLLSKYIRRGMNIVDAGSNTGYYALMFASFEQEYAGDPGRVYAFEPGPFASKRIMETLSYNELLNVHFEPVALGDVTGEQPIYVSRDLSCSRRSMLPFAESFPINVQVKRLDNCLQEKNVKKVDLLRLDVNGYEPNVLNGASKYLREKRIETILCTFDEFWLSKNQSGRAALYELIAAYGYRDIIASSTMKGGVQSVLLTYK